MAKLKTGIPGLDTLTFGGIPEKNVVLLSGGPGSGKSIMCSQFITYGALSDEPGVYITMEEEPDQLISNMAKFGMDMKDPNIEISKMTLYNFETLKDTVSGLVEKIRAKRLVIDPITHLGLFFDRNIEIRRSLVDLVDTVKRLGVTAILSAEIPTGFMSEGKVSTYGVEEFVTDGVIVLHNVKREGARIHAVEVLKMRGSEHEKAICPFDITKKGIVVYPDQRIF